MDLTERKLRGKLCLDGHFLKVHCDNVVLPNAQQARREYIVHPGAVMIVPLRDTANGLQLLLERQYRYPVGEAIIEFPAGKMDPGEDLLSCGRRELREETGLEAGQWAYAQFFYPTAAYSTEKLHILFARDLLQRERQLDADEFLEVFWLSVEEFFLDCQQGRICDAKTLIAALWLQNVMSGQWTLKWQQDPL